MKNICQKLASRPPAVFQSQFNRKVWLLIKSLNQPECYITEIRSFPCVSLQSLWWAGGSITKHCQCEQQRDMENHIYSWCNSVNTISLHFSSLVQIIWNNSPLKSQTVLYDWRMQLFLFLMQLRKAIENHLPLLRNHNGNIWNLRLFFWNIVFPCKIVPKYNLEYLINDL